jgi:predicted kinase
MRKWMRDRLRRRKAKPEAAAAEAAPAPLQPAFYDTEPHAQPAAPPVETTRESPEAETTPEPVTEMGTVEQAQPVSRNGDARRRRRQRSRGGRGHGKGGTEPAQAITGTQASAPEVKAASVSPQAEAGPVAPTPVAPARPHKGTVVLAIGLPGSGKSAWFKRHNITPLSSDLVRALLFDDPTEQRFQDLVFSNLRSMLRARLIARRPMNYVDATNLTPHDRHGWIKLAKDHGYEVHAVFFDVPVEVCLQRNTRRARVVPEDVMRRMAAKLKPPTFEEGFARITVVRVKHKE